MKLKIKQADKLDQVARKEDVRDLIRQFGGEFVPPLNIRGSTHQTFFFKKNNINDDNYYNELLQQPVILYYNKKGEIKAFCSYIKDYKISFLNEFPPSIYVTTIIVSKSIRSKGIAKSLYDFLIFKYQKENYISTRTWSHNYAHINLIKKLGFKLVHRISNHRGPNVDTVYYALKQNGLIE